MTGTLKGKEAFWRAHVRAQAQSGLTIGDYCKKQGVNYHTFRYWKQKLGKQALGRGMGPFPVIKVGRVHGGGSKGFDMRIRLKGSGHEIEVGRGFSEEALYRLIRVVEGV